jgi:hypothetical protein
MERFLVRIKSTEPIEPTVVEDKPEDKPEYKPEYKPVDKPEDKPEDKPKYKQLYDNKIDFDEASREWRKNKKYVGNGNFVYKCLYISNRTNSYCKNKLYKDTTYCKYHYKNLKNIEKNIC